MGKVDDMASVSAITTGVEEPVILIDIQQRYFAGITALELYEATRGAWHIGIRREAAKYAFAVSDYMVREVYEIHSWHRAGTTPYRLKPFVSFAVEGRWEFIGRPAREALRTKYLNMNAAQYFTKVQQQHHIAYINC